VAAPRCLWADALTKVVALTGRADHPALAARGATAWLHGGEGPA
jgi:thiamine biosynthesis lipoprotein